MNNKWIPEIMYEEDSNIPFVMVPQGKAMPELLYIFESRDTGQTEPNHEGEEVPIYEWDLHQYADMAILKNKLSQNVYDKVRHTLGLESLEVATTKGEDLTQKIKNNLDN
jgi:hypothetical protein